MPQRYTTEEWVVLASVIHDGRYDYSNVDYRNSKTDVEVICPEPEHGPFLVEPHRHTGARKKGCPICNPPKRRTVDTSVFVEDAIEVHGDKYDYSKVDYQGMKTKCEMICPKHKSFYRNYKSHIRNRMGCPLCEAISKAEKRFGTQKTPVLGEHDPDHPERSGFLDEFDLETELSPRYNPEYHGAPDTGNRTKEQRKAHREYALAVRFAREDPENSLNKCRKIAEIYSHTLLFEKNGEVSPKTRESLDEMISQCKHQGLIDPMTARILNSLQDWGNLGSHARYGHKGKYLDYERIKPILAHAEQLLGDWIEDFVPLEH